MRNRDLFLIEDLLGVTIVESVQGASHPRNRSSTLVEDVIRAPFSRAGSRRSATGISTRFIQRGFSHRAFSFPD
jgi:hypothetical protein